MRRLVPALLAALVAIAVTVGPALAIWPTTCVEANDAFEFAAGRHENVGIYQRVYGYPGAAESACRSDHRDDVRSAFQWAVQGADAAPAPPAQNPSTSPDYERVRAVATARSSNTALADTIAADVIGRATVDAFLRGTDAGVQYGQWPCMWRTTTCPLHPEEPPPPPTPRIAPELQEAWALMLTTDTGRFLLEGNRERADSVRVRLSWSLSASTVAQYNARTHVIEYNGNLLGERLSAVAGSLAHEFWHAVSTLPWRSSYAGCIAEEVWGHVVEATVWIELAGPNLPSTTVVEQSLTNSVTLARAQIGALDFDGDVADWLYLTSYVATAYAASCGGSA